MNSIPQTANSGSNEPAENVKKTESIAVVCGDITAALNRRPELMQLFRSSCEKAYFFCPEHDQKYFDQIEELGFELTITPVNTQGMNPVHDVGYFRRIYKLLKEKRPDHVFVFHIKQILYTSLACRMLGIKCHCLFAGLGYLFSEEQSFKRRMVGSLATRMLRSALKRATTVFFQNPDDYETFNKRRILSRDANAVVVDGSGVSLTDFPFSDPTGELPITFLLIARILRDKGLPEYYAAAKDLKSRWGDRINCQLMGPFDDNPNSMSREEIDKWHNEGIIEYLGVTEDVRPYLKAASVFVLPSFYMEGTPKIILESLATGLPVITTNSRGCRETVIDGQNGILIEPRDIAGLTAAMESFLEDPGRTVPMGKASRELAETRYDVNKINARMAEVMGIA
ncbi:MAG: glycosyltransferase family 4 protein [Planctomycetota bacterium]